MTKYILSLIFCGGFLLSAAQNYYNGTELNSARWSIKVSPLSLIEPDQAISLATEIRPLPNIGIQIEGGYIFNTVNISTNRIVSNTRGFRMVPEIRYYDINFKRNLQRYAGLQFSYKQLNKDLEQWTQKNNFEQLENIQLKKYNMTCAIIGGLQNHANLIGYDFNVGFGLKYKSVSVNSSTYRNDLNENRYGESGTGFFPQLTASFKLCIKII